MTEVTASDVKALRDMTGAGMMDCKRALQEADGDIDAAATWLREKGIAGAAKLAGREASEGTVQGYIHHNGRVGVLVEIDCNTDFVARNDEFVEFAKGVAAHIAAAAPQYVSEDEIPADVRASELQIAESQLPDSVPADRREQAAQGKVGKWLEEVVLLAQPHVNADRHEGKTIEQLRAELSAKTGENIVIRRFARFAIGQG
jgi:elongation factor Ts